MRVIISLVALGAVIRAATAENCEDKTITRKSIAKLTREARDAQLTLDVLVSREDVVAASLSATARGNFGGSDSPAKFADVTTSGASLRCEGGEASQCSAWYICGDATDATAAVVDGVIVAAVTISDAVEFDYCPNGGLAEVEVSVDFTVRRCEPAPAPTPRPTPAAPPSAKRKKRSSAPAAFELTMAVLVLTVAGVGFLLVLLLRSRVPCARSARRRDHEGGRRNQSEGGRGGFVFEVVSERRRIGSGCYVC